MPLVAAPSRVVISDQTLAGTSNDIVFSSIPQGFRDLQIVGVARGDTAATSVTVQINLNSDSTAANYDVEELLGAASVASAVTAASNVSIAAVAAANATASHPGSFTILVPNYTGTTFFKHSIGEFFYFDGTNRNAAIFDSVWKNAAAVTRVDLKPSAGNFIIGSRFTLIGVM